jgi:rsbT co-antagonist protein RsbR
MDNTSKNRLARMIAQHESDLLAEWIREQTTVSPRQLALMKESELREQCAEFLKVLRAVLQGGYSDDLNSAEWGPAREFLASVSRSRAEQGFTPAETAQFIFSLKRPVFSRLRKELGADAQALGEEIWTATEVFDRLGLYTTEVFQRTREETISRQQQEMLELSTPVVKLWEGILALPLIGTLDSARTQIVMESLLHKIVDTGSAVAIIDITGVPTVDTLVAQHLLKTVTAARLMGADCIISGIRPQIAQTIVHLGVALGDVTTKANLADAFVLALQRTGRAISVTHREKK